MKTSINCKMNYVKWTLFLLHAKKHISVPFFILELILPIWSPCLMLAALDIGRKLFCKRCWYGDLYQRSHVTDRTCIYCLHATNTASIWQRRFAQVDRENIFWRSHAKKASIPCLQNQATYSETGPARISQAQRNPTCRTMAIQHFEASTETPASPAPALPGKRVALYHVAHSRAGDKGNDMNFSVIPHSPADIGRLRSVITPDWVKNAVSPLLGSSSFPDERDVQHRNKLLELVTVEIYYVPGISSLNVVVRNILDGGVNCSRRIDRHGKTLSDVILCQQVILPPWLSIFLSLFELKYGK